MLASDLQEALIEDGFAFIQGVLLEAVHVGTGGTAVCDSQGLRSGG